MIEAVVLTILVVHAVVMQFQLRSTRSELRTVRAENQALREKLRTLGYAVALGLFAPSPAAAFPLPRKAVTLVTPEDQLRLAIADLVLNVRPEDAPYVRYLSFHVVANLYGEAALPAFRLTFRDQLNWKNASRNPVPEVEIDGPRGTVEHTRTATLVRIDIRRAVNWTRPAWVLVADRDYLMREIPLGTLPHRETQFGRLVVGIEQNPKTLSAGFLLNAYQLYRDLQELARSDTGHDLLYAAERHPDPERVIEFVDLTREAVPDTVEVPAPPKLTYPYNAKVVVDRAFVEGDGHRVLRELHRGDGFQVTNPPDRFGYVYGKSGAGDKGSAAVEGWMLASGLAFDPERNPKPPAPPPVAKAGAKGVPLVPKRPISVRDAGKGVKDFPATLDDFQKRWGVKGREEKLKVFLFDPAVGGIALAADSDPFAGSFVAAGADRLVRVEAGEFGPVMTTFDNKVPKDAADQIERDQFFNVTQGVIRFDGGESLATMPNGMQAEFLFDGEKKSVAVANPELAVHLEKKSTDPRYPSVRVGYCRSCHAATNGFNGFVEQVGSARELGIKFNVPADRAQEVDDFYRGWQRQVKRWRLPYEEYLEAVTADEKGKPWTGAKLWAAQMEWRDKYDLPVTIRGASADYGIPVEDLRQALMQRREDAGPPQTRLNQLSIDRGVPRRTYDANVSRDLALWLGLVQPKYQKARVIVAPQVITDAVNKFLKEPRK